MRIGIPKETLPGETRVAATPKPTMAKPLWVTMNKPLAVSRRKVRMGRHHVQCKIIWENQRSL